MLTRTLEIEIRTQFRDGSTTQITSVVFEFSLKPTTIINFINFRRTISYRSSSALQ